MLQSLLVPRPEPLAEAPQPLCPDKGYDVEEVRAVAAACGLVAHIRSRREQTEAKARGLASQPGAGWWNAPTAG